MLKHGDTVSLGGVRLRAVHAPGHTQGATTWVTTVEDRGRQYVVAVLGGMGPNGGVPLLENPRHKTVIEDTQRMFGRLKAEKVPDIYLVGHPQAMFEGKVARIKAGETPHPLLNGDAWTKQIVDAEAAFQKRVAAERASRGRTDSQEGTEPRRGEGAPLCEPPVNPFPPSPLNGAAVRGTVCRIRPRDDSSGRIERWRAATAKDLHPEIFSSSMGTCTAYDSPRLPRGFSRFAVAALQPPAVIDAFTPTPCPQCPTTNDPRRIGTIRRRKGTRHEGYRRIRHPWPVPAVVVVRPAGRESTSRVTPPRGGQFVAFPRRPNPPLGGWAVSQSAPNNREKGQQMMARMDSKKQIEDHIAAVSFLRTHSLTNGRVGVVGFCWGGGMTNTLAVRVPDLNAAVPYYGAQPAAADVAKIQAPLLIHYGGLDERVNADGRLRGGAQGRREDLHGRTSTKAPSTRSKRCGRASLHKPSADIAWQRTIDFLNRQLRS